MFKNILVPIDGSRLAQSSAKVAIELAVLCEASIVVLYVATPFDRFFQASGVNPTPKDYQKQFDQLENNQAHAAIAPIIAMAERAKLKCFTEIVFDKIPARAIVNAAITHNADLVVMGSHGYRGVKKLLLGSTTQEVLTRIGAVPVLVHRDQAAADATGWEDDEQTGDI
jgi:nucleotide-binding universal stress UspA family protein